MKQQEVHDLIREHGGIVHGDGNIFFTNAVQFGLVVAAMSQEEALDKSCHMPPIGWRCTRSAGHDGPCAAVACPEDVEFVEKGMRRLREAGISDGQPSQEYAELPEHDSTPMPMGMAMDPDGFQAWHPVGAIFHCGQPSPATVQQGEKT